MIRIRNNKLLENIFSLSVLQAANYLLPLITIPFLVRVLGPERFGLVAFAQAIGLILMTFTDYGFNLSATREISINKMDKVRINEIFSSVFVIKLLFVCLSLIVLTAIILIFDKLRADWKLYYLFFGVVVGNLFFFLWYFQGIEKMKYVTILNILAKLIFTISVFFLVRRPEHYLIVAALNSLGYILAGALSIYFAFGVFRVKLVKPSLLSLSNELKNGYYVFVSQIASMLYTNSNIVILGILTNNVSVGYYSAGEKIIKAIQYLFNPISLAIFPHISFLAENSRENALKFIRKVLYFFGAIFFIASLIMLIFAKPLVLLLLGAEYLPAIMIVRILAFLPFICCLGNIFGTQIMINFGLAHIFARIVSIAGLLNILAAFIFVPLLKHNGMAAIMLTTETIIMLSMLIVLELNKLSPRKKWIKTNF